MTLPLSEVYAQPDEDIHRQILEHQPNYPPVHKHDTYILKLINTDNKYNFVSMINRFKPFSFTDCRAALAVRSTMVLVTNPMNSCTLLR